MADRSRRDVRKTTASLNSPWLSNALKSMGVASTDVIKDLMPAVSETFDSGGKAAVEAAKSIRAAKSQNTNIAKALSQNQAVKTAQTILNKAVSDIKSGKIYNTDIDMSDMGEDLDFNFDDLDFSDFGDEDSPAPDVNVVNTQVVNDGATIKAISQQTEYQVQAAKATVDTMVSLSASSIARTTEIGSAMLSELTSINKNIAALVEYQNTNMTKFIEASIGYYEQAMTKTEEASSSTSFNQNNIFGSSGGLDFGAYKEFVKQNIQNASSNNMASSMISMLSMAPGMVVPTLIKEGMKTLVPSLMKQSMEALDSAFQDAVPIILERIGDLRNSSESGIFGTITRFIGNTFGTQTVRKEKFDGSKIQKGPIPYNGVAQQTIVNIIPKYLRESNSYLKEIAEAITGKSGKSMADNSEGFNWEKGEFQSIDQIRDEIYSTVSREVDTVFSRSKFGKALDENRNTLKSEEDRRNYDDALTQLYAAMERKKGEVDFSNEEVRNFLMKDVHASQNIKNSIEAFLLMNKDLQGSANNAKLQASIKKNTQMMALEDDIDNNGLRQVMDEKYDDWMKRKFKSGSSSATIGGTIGTSKSGLSIPTQLQNIYNLLERGIFVKTVKKLGKFSPATDETSGYAETVQVSDMVMDSASTEVQSIEDYKKAIQEKQNATLEANETAMKEAESGNVWKRANAKGAGTLNKVTKVLVGIATGDSDMLNDAMKQLVNFVDEKLFTPIKTALFGEKDEAGYIRDGLFSGIQNRMKESMYGLRRIITGKGYVTADGERVENANEKEMKNTVVGKLKSVLNTVKTGIEQKLFGTEQETDENGNVVKDGKEGLVSKTKGVLLNATSAFTKGLHGWKVALFGEDKDDSPEKTKKSFKEAMEKNLPNAVVGVGAGLGTNMLLGGSLLGMAINPVGGALLGLAAGVAANSSKFKEFLFGKDLTDENGNKVGRAQGLINDKVQDFFKKNGKLAIGGAALGGLKGALFGSNFGLLGSLVGGPLAGALVGAGAAILTKTEMFQRFLHGDPKNGQLGLIKTVKNMFSGFGKINGDASGGKLAGMMGIGAGVGALTLGALSNAGIFGLALGPAGPIGGAILGLGASMLAQKDNFKEWLFGKKDENGNKTKEGILGQFKNMLTVTVFKPLATNFKAIGRDFKTFLEYDILDRFNLVIEPIGKAVFGTLSKLTNTAMDSLGDLGTYIKEDFLSNIVDHTKKMLAPITAGVKTVTNAFYTAGKHIVSAPLKVMSAITSPLVQGITGFIGGTIGMVGKTVNNLLVKPINTLILKPLAKTVEIAGKVVSAPFVLVNKLVTPIITKTTEFFAHVGRFVNKAASHVGNAIIKPFKDLGNHIKEGVNNAKNLLLDVTLRPIGLLIKSAATEIKDHIKTKVNGFFSKIGNGIKSVFKGIGGFFGDRLKAIGGKIGSGAGKVGQWWRDTAYGESEDYTGKDLTYTQRRKALKEARRAELERNKAAVNEDRLHDKNSQLIAKWTKNQVTEDTEENRELARIAARRRGKVINFEGDARKTEQQKAMDAQLDATKDQTEVQEETRDIGKSIHGVLTNILNAITGKKLNAISDEDYFNRRNAEINPEARQITEQEKMEQKIQSQKQGEAVGETELTGRWKESRMQKHDKKIMARYAQNVRDYGLIGGIAQNFRNTISQIKGGYQGFKNKLEKHAEGTDSANAGLAIVGENGPEAVYGKNAKFGKMVGLAGPEVIQMEGGETVIPNSRIQKFADGTDNSDASKEAESIDDNTEEINKTLQGKVVGLLNDIKSAIVGKVSSVVSGVTTGQTTPGGTFVKSLQQQSDAETGDDSKKAAIDYASLTGESQRAAAAAQREADEDDARIDQMNATLSNIDKEQKEHNEEWSSILGKKGFLVAGILGLSAWLKNRLKNFSIGDILGNISLDLGFGLDNLGDFKNVLQTFSDKVKDLGEVVGDLLSFNPFKAIKDFILDENGNTDHESAARARFLGVQFAHLNTKYQNFLDDIAEKRAKKAARKAAKEARKADKAAKRVAKKGAQNSADDIAEATIRSNVDDAAEATIKTFGDDATEAGWRALQEANGFADDAMEATIKDNVDDVAKAAVKDNVDDVAKTAVKTNADDIAKATVKSKADDVAKATVKNADDIAKAGQKTGAGLIDNAVSCVKTLINGFVDKVAKKFGSTKLAKHLTGITTKIVTGIKSTKVYKFLVAKLAPFFAATAGLASTVVLYAAKEVTWVVLGAVSGATGAKRLFRTDSVDVLMVGISTALGAWNGTTVGSVCDIVNEVLATILGIDIYSELATAAYAFLAGDEAYDKLIEGKEKFQAEYEEYKNKEIQTQYDTMINAGLLDKSVTIEEYEAGLQDGTYAASVQSFSDYNAKQHKTLGSTVLDGIVGAGKGIAKGTKAVGAFFGGKNVTYYTDDKGNRYTKNEDGTYHVVTKSGEEGDLSKDAIKDILSNPKNKHEDHQAGIIEKAKNGIVNAGQAAGKSISEFFGNVKENGSEKITFAVEAVKAVQTGRQKIEEVFNNKDNNLDAYINADVNTLDESNPLHGTVGGILNVSKVVSLPVLIAKGIGSRIGNAIKNLLGGIGSDFTALKQSENIINSSVLNGDPDTISNYQYTGTGPISGFLNGLVGFRKMLLAPAASVVKTGKETKEKFIAWLEPFKSDFAALKQSEAIINGAVLNGDPDTITNYEYTGTSSIAGFLSGLVGLRKTVLSPVAGVVKTGKEMKEKFDSWMEPIKSDFALMRNSAGVLNGYAVSGDTDSLLNYSINTTSSIGGLMGGIVNVEKYMLSPIAGIVKVGKTIKEKIGKAFSSAKDLGASIKSFIGKLNEYTDPDKDMNSFAKLTMDGDTDDPVTSVLSTIIRNVMGVYVKLIRGVKALGKTIAELPGNAIDFIKEKGTNIIDGLMDYARGGSGSGHRASSKRGGRGELNGSTYYSQNDPAWASQKYIRSDGTDDGATIGDSGCGPTAMSMIISDMNSKQPTPVELAQYAQSTGDRDETGTNYNFIKKASNKYGLDSQEETNPSEQRIAELGNTGRPFLLAGYDNGNGNSPYTQAGHYLVGVGSDNHGNIIVNDPRGESYSGAIPISALANSTTSAWSFSHIAVNGASGDRKRRKITVREGGRGVDRTLWIAIVQAVKKAIADKKPGYSQSNRISITVGGKTLKVRTDCSGMVTVALQYYGVVPKNVALSTLNLVNKNDAYMKSSGFKSRPFTSWDDLQTGDIVAFRNGSHGHTEIYAGKQGSQYYVWNCGATSSVNNPSYTPKSYDTYSIVWSPGEPGKNAVTDLTMDDIGLNSNGTSRSGASINFSLGTSTSSNTEETQETLWDKIVNIGSSIGKIGGALFDFILGGGKEPIDWDQVLQGNNTSSSYSSSSYSGATLTGATNISGSTQAEKIWNYLRGKGMSKQGVAGLMGNLQAESGLVPNNLQNSYNQSLRMSDEEYTRAVNNGSYTNFAGDSAGYGLAQWTSSGRKDGLLKLARSKNLAIDDLGLQLDWLWEELSGSYRSVLNTLMNANNVKVASNSVLHDFERPADQSAAVENKRASMGQAFYDLYAKGGKGGRGGFGTGTTKITPSVKLAPRKYAISQNTGNEGGHGDIPDVIRQSITTRKSIPSSTITNNSINVDNSDLVALLTQVVQLLGSMAKDSKNLSYLKDFKPATISSVNITNNDNSTSNLKTPNNTPRPLGGSGNGMSNSEILARKIAFGG